MNSKDVERSRTYRTTVYREKLVVDIPVEVDTAVVSHTILVRSVH